MERSQLAARVRRHRLERPAACSVRRGMLSCWCPTTNAVWPLDAGTGVDSIRYTCAEGAIFANYPDNGRVVVPMLFRARCRLRSGIADHPSAAPGGHLCD